MSRGRFREDWKDCLNNAFVRDVHQLLAWGHQGAKASISSNDEEPVITGRIVAAIDAVLDHPDTPEHYDRYERPHENKPIQSADREGKHRPMPDIVLSMAGARPRPSFTIEAKRLRSGGFPIGEYVGHSGLKCFVRGEYAAGSPVAAMVAYIQSHTPPHWLAQLADRLCSDTDGNLRIKRSLAPVSVIPDLPHEWVSEHHRKDSTPISVFHIFLDCCDPNGDPGAASAPLLPLCFTLPVNNI